MKQNETADVSYYSEICCRRCNEIAHNHFDCPVCELENAPGSAYCELRVDASVSCQECEAEFVVDDIDVGQTLTLRYRRGGSDD